jgi:hypothetical protein
MRIGHNFWCDYLGQSDLGFRSGGAKLADLRRNQNQHLCTPLPAKSPSPTPKPRAKPFPTSPPATNATTRALSSVSGSVGERRLRPAFGVDPGEGLAAPGEQSRSGKIDIATGSGRGSRRSLACVRGTVGERRFCWVRVRVWGRNGFGLDDSREPGCFESAAGAIFESVRKLRELPTRRERAARGGLWDYIIKPA